MNTQEIQKILKWAWVVLIILAAFLAVETLGALKGLRGINPAYNSISVTGVGEAVTVPDVATFSFTVSADAETVSEAQEQVTTKTDAVLTKLKELEVEEKDIKTTDYSIWPKYTYTQAVCSPAYCPPGRQVADGYTVSHNISVKIRNTKDAGKALALVGENGATGLSGISFTTDDPDQVINEARAKAIENTKEKAQMLAKELGVRLVRVVSFYDNTGDRPMPYYGEGMGGDMMVKSSTVSIPEIPVGENKTTISVTVTYEIR